MSQTKATSRTQMFSERATAQVVRYWTRVHVEVREPRWLSDVRTVKFR